MAKTWLNEDLKDILPHNAVTEDMVLDEKSIIGSLKKEDLPEELRKDMVDRDIVKIMKAKAGLGKTTTLLEAVLEDDIPCLILVPFVGDAKTIEGISLKIDDLGVNRQHGDRESRTFDLIRNVTVMTYNMFVYGRYSKDVFRWMKKVKKEGYIQRWIRGVFNEI